MLGARTRGVIVAVCSFFFPGLGQALLRRWVRALLFAGLFIGTAAVFAPDSVFSADGGFDGVLRAAQQATTELSLAGTVALTIVQVGAMLDAYVQAIRGHQPKTTSGPTCPQCGREIEPSHGFCHWCTYEFEDPSENPPESPENPPDPPT